MSDSLGSRFVGALDNVLDKATQTFESIAPYFISKKEAQAGLPQQMLTGQEVVEVEAEKVGYQTVAIGLTLFLVLVFVGLVRIRG
jgi:hypothetical protein